VKLRKDTVSFFLTRGNVENKVGFGDTGEIIGGTGRSPLHMVCCQTTYLFGCGKIHTTSR